MSDTKTNVMTSIVGLCLSTNLKASQIYEQLSIRSQTSELKGFWLAMAAEERERSDVWQQLMRFADEDMLPEIFIEPNSVREELEEVERSVNDLLMRIRSTAGVSDSFILAFRLELYLLHQALDTLYNLMSAISEDEELTDNYEKRIGRLIDMLDKYGEVTSETKLLGETLHRLWRDNRTTALYGTIDDLTGLYSRRGFRNAAIPLCHLAQRNDFNICILIADIDDLRLVNEEHGHFRGDEVLKKVAAAIRSNIRTCDVIARYGGDEFIILFSKADKDAVKLLAEKIRRVVEQETRDLMPVTVSIGVADGVLSRDIEGSLRDIQEQALENTREAQRRGRNQVVTNSD